MKKILIIFGVLFHWLWKLLGIGRLLITNLFFLLLLLVLVVSIFYRPKVHVPAGSALLLNPAGNIVEKKTIIDPLADIINDATGVPVYEETLLQDLLDTINHAAEDDRIKLMVLSLGEMDHVGLNQLQTLGKSLDAFKKQGKSIIAYGDAYSQSQYFLAAHGDEIYLNPMGLVELRGFGIFRLYAKELLDKLDINFHVFKVGSYKSALEPLTRNSMSPEAREANLLWLRQLWKMYSDEISLQRNLKPGGIENLIDNIEHRLAATGGDTALLALKAGLVDGLKTHQQFEDHLLRLTGSSSDNQAYNRIQFQDYLTTFTPSYTEPQEDRSQIGIIVAQGDIIHGPGAPGLIGSESLAKTISRARKDAAIKALVLRIDSGGGSALASEIIRQQVKLTRDSGKPVVVSMGTLAASGGYWISANANQIWASPATLTGSIGIFGAIPTFEKTLAKIGISGDGVGTTKLARGINPTLALSPALAESIQLNVENGYDRFLQIVSRGRSISVENVSKIAEGRVWDGATAKNLGLVDTLGGLTEAISAAAELAGVTEYAPVYVKENLSRRDELIKKLGSQTTGYQKSFKILFMKLFPGRASQLIDHLSKKFLFPFLNDPTNMYAHSLLNRELLAF